MKLSTHQEGSMKTRWPVLLACLASFVVAASAANWPQWRGPERDGISRETGLLKEWPKEGQNSFGGQRVLAVATPRPPWWGSDSTF